jgi:hypothetical protein
VWTCLDFVIVCVRTVYYLWGQSEPGSDFSNYICLLKSKILPKKLANFYSKLGREKVSAFYWENCYRLMGFKGTGTWDWKCQNDVHGWTGLN